MSCGVPNIVVNYSATPEVVGKTGFKVDVSDWSYHSHYNYRGALVDVKKLAEAMRIMYDDEKQRKNLGKKARKRALQYDWDSRIVPAWKQLLDGYFLQKL
jgi:glycosyltransferase involved in cell wall biosynthesis